MGKLPANRATKAYDTEMKRIINSAPKRASKSQGSRAPKMTPDERRAEIERVAREHGADLSEEAFNEASRKVGKSRA